MEILIVSCISLLVVGIWSVVLITGQEEAKMRGCITLFMGKTFSFFLLALSLVFVYLGVKYNG